MRLFNIFDSRGKGSASLAEIQKVFHENLEIGVTDNEINEIFSDIESEKSYVTLKEFNSM